MPLAAPMNLITNNPEFSAVFARDPFGGGSRVPLAFFASLLDFDVVREPENFSTPVLAAHPSDDPWTPPILSRPFFDRIAGPKKWVDLPGCGHFPYEEPGAAIMWESVDRFLGKVAGASQTDAPTRPY